MGGQDQNVLGVPTTNYGSTADVQSSLTFATANSSTAYFTTDMTDAYNGTYVVTLALYAKGPVY